MKILIVRLSSMGDVVLTSPIVRCIKTQLPDAEVHFLVREPFACLLTANPSVDKCITVRRAPSEKLAELRAEAYDFVVDLQGNLRTARLRRALGVRGAVFPKLNLRKWLWVNLKWNLMPKGLHVVDRYFAAAKSLGVKNDGQGLDCFIAPEDEVDPQSLSPDLRPGAYTAIAVGATYFTKRIPVAKLIEWCQAHFPEPVVLLGGPEDTATGAAVVAATGPHVVNACGAFRIPQSASLLRQSRRVVAPDTGLMHLSAALRKPLTVYWGSTAPDLGMGPYYPEGLAHLATHHEVALACRPCSKLGKKACPKGHFGCMMRQEMGPTAISS